MFLVRAPLTPGICRYPEYCLNEISRCSAPGKLTISSASYNAFTDSINDNTTNNINDVFILTVFNNSNNNNNANNNNNNNNINNNNLTLYYLYTELYTRM